MLHFFLFLKVSVPFRDAIHGKQGCLFQLILNSDVQVKRNYSYSINYKRVLRPVQIQGEGTQIPPFGGVWPVHISEEHVGCDILLWPSLENTVGHTWLAA